MKTITEGEVLKPDLVRRLVAEGLGTLLLVATVVGSGIMAEQLAGGNAVCARMQPGANCRRFGGGAALWLAFAQRGKGVGARISAARIVCLSWCYPPFLKPHP